MKGPEQGGGMPPGPESSGLELAITPEQARKERQANAEKAAKAREYFKMNKKDAMNADLEENAQKWEGKDGKAELAAEAKRQDIEAAYKKGVEDGKLQQQQLQAGAARIEAKAADAGIPLEASEKKELTAIDAAGSAANEALVEQLDAAAGKVETDDDRFDRTLRMMQEKTPVRIKRSNGAYVTGIVARPTMIGMTDMVVVEWKGDDGKDYTKPVELRDLDAWQEAPAAGKGAEKAAGNVEVTEDRRGRMGRMEREQTPVRIKRSSGEFVDGHVDVVVGDKIAVVWKEKDGKERVKRVTLEELDSWQEAPAADTKAPIDAKFKEVTTLEELDATYKGGMSAKEAVTKLASPDLTQEEYMEIIKKFNEGHDRSTATMYRDFDVSEQVPGLRIKYWNNGSVSMSGGWSRRAEAGKDTKERITPEACHTIEDLEKHYPGIKASLDTLTNAKTRDEFVATMEAYNAAHKTNAPFATRGRVDMASWGDGKVVDRLDLPDFVAGVQVRYYDNGETYITATYADEVAHLRAQMSTDEIADLRAQMKKYQGLGVLSGLMGKGRQEKQDLAEKLAAAEIKGRMALAEIAAQSVLASNAEALKKTSAELDAILEKKGLSPKAHSGVLTAIGRRWGRVINATLVGGSLLLGADTRGAEEHGAQKKAIAGSIEGTMSVGDIEIIKTPAASPEMVLPEPTAEDIAPAPVSEAPASADVLPAAPTEQVTQPTTGGRSDEVAPATAKEQEESIESIVEGALAVEKKVEKKTAKKSVAETSASKPVDIDALFAGSRDALLKKVDGGNIEAGDPMPVAHFSETGREGKVPEGAIDHVEFGSGNTADFTYDASGKVTDVAVSAKPRADFGGILKENAVAIIAQESGTEKIDMDITVKAAEARVRDLDVRLQAYQAMVKNDQKGTPEAKFLGRQIAKEKKAIEAEYGNIFRV